MENRSKFYSGGLWSKDDMPTRRDHINWALKAYNDNQLDKQELKFIIKNAFVSKIYVSKNVVKIFDPKMNPNLLKDIFGTDLLALYETLVNNGVLCLNDNPKLQKCVFFDICKLSDRISTYNNKQRKSGKNEVPKIIIEHVIPGEEYMKRMIKKEIKFLGPQEFIAIFDVVSICLVTKDEDYEFNKHGLRQKMPENCEYENAPFARYEEAGIKIHGPWTIVNGRLEEELK